MRCVGPTRMRAKRPKTAVQLTVNRVRFTRKLKVRKIKKLWYVCDDDYYPDIGIFGFNPAEGFPTRDIARWVKKQIEK